jgi:hypothetical protein
MRDLQVVQVRDVAVLKGIGFGAMLRIEDVKISSISSVLVNGVESQFFVSDSPLDPLVELAGGGFLGVLYVYLSPDYNLQSVYSIRIFRREVIADGTETLKSEDVELGGEVLDLSAPAGSRKVTIDSGMLSLRGEGFRKATSVMVNKTPQKFIIVSDSKILSAMPDDAGAIDSVDVIVDAEGITRTSFFEYILGSEPKTVSGPFKLVQQFIKLLMTTKGTNLWDLGEGGDFQRWVGQTIPMNAPQVLIAKTTLQVMAAATYLQLGQSGTNIPADERLSDVTILNMGLDPADPTVMELSLKLNTFSSRTAFFSLLVQQTQELAGDLTAEYSSLAGTSIEM